MSPDSPLKTIFVNAEKARMKRARGVSVGLASFQRRECAGRKVSVTRAHCCSITSRIIRAFNQSPGDCVSVVVAHHACDVG